MVINPIVGVYIPIIRIPIKGGMTIPNIATFDHGTCQEFVPWWVTGVAATNPSQASFIQVGSEYLGTWAKDAQEKAPWNEII